MKVYVVVDVLFIDGDQFPVMLLFDVVGNVIIPPEHIAATDVNVGRIVPLFTAIVIAAVVAH